MQTIRKTILLLTGGLTMAAFSLAGQQTYFNGFTSEGFPHTSPDVAPPDGWTLDTENEVMNLAIGGGTRNRTAGAFLDGWESTSFVVSTEFTVNNVAANAFVGLLAFGSGVHDNGYLGQWDAASANAGRITILGLGTGGGFTAPTENLTGIGAVAGNSYRFELVGTYTETTLNIQFSVFDITTTPTLIGSVSTTDTAPLTNNYFGVRSRTTGGSSIIDFDYDSFSVIPEPSTYALIVGLMVLGGAALRRRKNTGQATGVLG